MTLTGRYYLLAKPTDNANGGLLRIQISMEIPWEAINRRNK